jgi:alcohol dehydrogenase
MRQLQLERSGHLVWSEVAEPEIHDRGDAIVRPFLAGRCDGDTLPIHRPVSRVMQAGIALGAIDPVVACVCGKVPFKGPFAIGHECIAEVSEIGPGVENLRVGQAVVVPWALSCGSCVECRRGLTSKCSTMRSGNELAAFGFGPASGPWGGLISDLVRIPHADHMLVSVPDEVDPLRVASASDNLADGWRSVVPALRARPEGSVLVIGGGAQSIGLYAAGLAVAHGAKRVDYLDPSAGRRQIAESLGANAVRLNGRLRRASTVGHYDVVVEASSRSSGLHHAIHSLAPGGMCTAVGYYLARGTRVPLMRMYVTDAALQLGVSHARSILPDLLDFIARTGFAAETVTTLTADWEDAPRAYTSKTTKVVLRRDRLSMGNDHGDRPSH